MENLLNGYTYRSMFEGVKFIEKESSINTVIMKVFIYGIFIVINLLYSILITAGVAMLIQLLNYAFNGNSGMTFAETGEFVGFWHSFGIRLLMFQVFYLVLQFCVNVVYELVLTFKRFINYFNREEK